MKKYIFGALALLTVVTSTLSSCSVSYRERHPRRGRVVVHERVIRN